MKKPLSQIVPRYLFYLWCGFVFLFLVAPIFVVVPISFSSSRFLQFPPPGFSLQWYEHYFTSREWIESTVTSFEVACVTCVLATVFGTILAVVLVKAKLPGRNLIYGLAVSPMIFPFIISAIALYFFYSRLHMVGSKSGVIIAHTILAIPYVLIIVSAALKGFDETLERASLSLGANPLKTFVLVVLPIIRPAVIFGALFAFIISFDEAVIIIFIAGIHAVTLPKRMWDGIRLEIDPTIAAVATLLIGFSIILMITIALSRKKQ